MTQLEQDLLANIKVSLIESTEKDWEYGHVEEWSDYAKKMRNNIKLACTVFDVMINQPKEDENFEEKK